MSHEVHFTCDVCKAQAPSSEAVGRWRRSYVGVWRVGDVKDAKIGCAEADVCSPVCFAKLAERTMQIDLVTPVGA